MAPEESAADRVVAAQAAVLAAKEDSVARVLAAQVVPEAQVAPDAAGPAATRGRKATSIRNFL